MTRDRLAVWWRQFAETECVAYSALYERIAMAVSDSDETLAFLLGLPAHALQPNMLLAAVHDRVLLGLESRLASCYAGRVGVDVGEEFLATVRRNRSAIASVMATRRVQTNEVGRVAFLAPALAALDLALPPTLIDVGTSAGLTLAMDRFRIDYGIHGQLGPADSPVRVDCEVLHGSPPVRPVAIADRVGLDRNPLDPADPDDRRWLLACTWPDTDRLARTRAALDLAVAHPSVVRAGDAVDALPGLIGESVGVVVITTTWVMAYLTSDRRTAFAECLADVSADRPVYWISAEAPGVVSTLPVTGELRSTE